METYVTRRLTVDAIQYVGDNADEIRHFMPDNRIRVNDNGKLEGLLSEGWMEIKPGWWAHTDTVTGALGLSSNVAFERFFRLPTAGEL